jgi:hypothetical protein
MVVASLEKVNAIVGHSVYQPVFLRHAPRPAARQGISEGVRFAETLEWIAQHGFTKSSTLAAAP